MVWWHLLSLFKLIPLLISLHQFQNPSSLQGEGFSSLLTILALVCRCWCLATCFHSAAHTVLTQLCLPPPSLYPSTSISSSLSITLIHNCRHIRLDSGGVPTKSCDKCVRSGVFLSFLWHLDAADRLCHPRPPLSPSVALRHMLTAPSSCQITEVSTVQF